MATSATCEVTILAARSSVVYAVVTAPDLFTEGRPDI